MNKQQRYELYKYAVGPGWWPILDKYLQMVFAVDPEADLYIKEKFGFLRLGVYSRHIPMNLHIAIESAAEQESAVTCECCGQPGKHHPELEWMMTLCEECYKGGSEAQMAAEAESELRWLNGSE